MTWTVGKGSAEYGVRTCTARSSIAAVILPSVHLAQGIPLLFHLEIKLLSFSQSYKAYSLFSPPFFHHSATWTEKRSWGEKRNSFPSFLWNVQASTWHTKAQQPPQPTPRFSFLKISRCLLNILKTFWKNKNDSPPIFTPFRKKENRGQAWKMCLRPVCAWSPKELLRLLIPPLW